MIACSNSMNRVAATSTSLVRRSQSVVSLPAPLTGSIYFPFHKRTGALVGLTPSCRNGHLTCFAAVQNQSAGEIGFLTCYRSRSCHLLTYLASIAWWTSLFFKTGMWSCGSWRDLGNWVWTDTRDVYQGIFGPWSLDPSDIEEVTYYRIGLSIAAAGAVLVWHEGV